MAELEESVKSKILGSNTGGEKKPEAEGEDEVSVVLSQRRRRNIEKLKGLDLENVVLEAQRDNIRLRGEVTGGVNMGETDEEKKLKAAKELEETAKRVELQKALYATCIESGGDPTTCAQVVAGIIPTPTATTMVSPQPTSITELVTALKALDDLRGSDRGLTDLKQSFDKLADEIKRGGDRQPLDPVAFAKQQAEQIKATYDAMVTIGIIKEPVATTAEGKPLEVVQEENRHAEKMEELKTEKFYKEQLGATLAELPEKIGRGLGGQIIERGESKSGSSLEFITCQEEGCGAKIFITPETGNRVECPKCGTSYTRRETAETE